MIFLLYLKFSLIFEQQESQKTGEELNKQFASALILFDCVYSCLYYMLSDEINMFKLTRKSTYYIYRIK